MFSIMSILIHKYLTELKEWAISEEKFEMNKESTGAAAWAVFYKTLAEQTFEELVVFDNAGNEISLATR